MGIEIRMRRPGDPEPAPGLLADRRLCLTSDDRLVEDGSLDSAKLLAGAGSTIPASEAARLRLEMVDGRVLQRSATPTPQLAEPESVVTEEEVVIADAKVTRQRKR